MPCPAQRATGKGHEMAECGFWRCFSKGRLQLSPEGIGEGQRCDPWQECGEGVKGSSGGAGREEEVGTGCDV